MFNAEFSKNFRKTAEGILKELLFGMSEEEAKEFVEKFSGESH